MESFNTGWNLHTSTIWRLFLFGGLLKEVTLKQIQQGYRSIVLVLTLMIVFCE